MADSLFGFFIWSSGLLAFVNLVLLIVGLVQKKLTGLGAVIVIVAAFVLPLLGFFFGMMVNDDNPFATIGYTLLGVVVGFAIAMWGDFIFLIVMLTRKSKADASTDYSDEDAVLDSFSDEDEVL